MGQTKCLMVLILLFGVEVQKSKATGKIYILSDISANASCSSQLNCTFATLGQCLLRNNGTLPIKTNVEYHFLSGQHQVPADMMLTNVNNFSIIGDVSTSSSPAVLVGCYHSFVLKISASYNVSIRNIKFQRCHNPQLQ